MDRTGLWLRTVPAVVGQDPFADPGAGNAVLAVRQGNAWQPQTIEEGGGGFAMSQARLGPGRGMIPSDAVIEGRAR